MKSPVLRISTSDGVQYWAIPIPRWWLDLFGWDHLRGNLWQRFLEQRRRRKLYVCAGQSMDILAAQYGLSRKLFESDAALRKRLVELFTAAGGRKP